MKKINEINWGVFFLNEIFEIKATNSSVDRNRLNGLKGDYPYITRTDKNNGWDSLVAHQTEYGLDDGNVITVGLDTQTAFYQPISFYTGQNIQILSNKNVNKYVASFIIPLLKKQMEKFNWGGNGATLGRLRKLKILLPKFDDDTPDYAYMEAYMKEVEKRLLTQYKTFLENKNHQTSIGVDKVLKTSWKAFFIEDIFGIQSGVRLTNSDKISGLRPFVGATDSNNGITSFVGNTNASLDKDVLGVNYNGSVIENFYHPYEAIFSDDVKRLHLKNVQGNKYIYLFIKNAILNQKVKYEYGYKFNGERMRRQKIMLPIDVNGNPDYAYMERFMMEKEASILNEYISRRLTEK